MFSSDQRSFLFLLPVSGQQLADSPVSGGARASVMEFKWDVHAGFFRRSLLSPGLPRQYTMADTQRVRMAEETMIRYQEQQYMTIGSCNNETRLYSILPYYYYILLLNICVISAVYDIQVNAFSTTAVCSHLNLYL